MIEHFPTWIDVNLDALAANLAQVRRRTNARVCVVLKADAYGHGLVRTAQFFQEQRVHSLAVSSAADGLQLRACGIRLPIWVLVPITAEEFPQAIQHRLTLTLTTAAALPPLIAAARQLGRRVLCQIKVDTGLGRIGVDCEQAAALIRQTDASERLQLTGVFTHFDRFDSSGAHVRRQLARFRRLQENVQQTLPSLTGLVWHCASSEAFSALPASHLDAVRLGTLLLGQGDRPQGPEWRRSWRLFSRLIQIRKLPPGTAVGYGRRFRTRRSTVVGIAPLGYSEGFSLYPVTEHTWRALRRFLRTLLVQPVGIIDGIGCPIIGRVSMNMVCLDLSQHPRALEQQGAAVEFPGRRTVVQWRIPKIYRQNNRCTAVWSDGTLKRSVDHANRQPPSAGDGR